MTQKINLSFRADARNLKNCFYNDLQISLRHRADRNDNLTLEVMRHFLTGVPKCTPSLYASATASITASDKVG